MTLAAVLAVAPADDFEDCVTSGRIFTSWLNPGCGIPSAIDVVTDPIGTATDVALLAPWEAAVKEGLSETVKTLVTFWIDVPNPDLGDIHARESTIVSFLQGSLMPLVAIIMCFTILFGAVTIAWTQRTTGMKNILAMLFLFMVVDVIGAGAIAVAMQVTDYFSQLLLDRSTNGTSFGDNLVAMMTDGGGVGSLLLIILLSIAILVAAFTCVLMIARGGILLALVGAMLLAVAMSMDERMQLLRHYMAWILAFILYKLAAAVVYSVGFRLLGTDTAAEGQGLLQVLYGLTLLFMAVLALPATIRLVVPAVAPAAQGRGAGAFATGVAATATTALIRR
jgi:type IV secretion system protein TrbL